MIKVIHSFLRDTTAAIMVAFALMAPVVVGSAGMALDFAHAYLVQQRLAQAIDSAALAAAASATDADVVEQKIRDFFAANYPPEKLGATFDPQVSIVDNVIHVSGNAYYNTFFLGIIGIDEIEVEAEAEVTRVVGNNVELALVLDISNSMNSLNKINDLKEAAKSLIDVVVYDNQEDYYSKVAIVPYGTAVNVGIYAAAARGSVPAGKGITAATKANPVVVTSNAHGFSNGDKVYITGVSGMTQLNNKIYTVASKTTNTFALSGVDGRGYSTYSSGGSIFCTAQGCQYQYFQNPSASWLTFPITSCVSERIGVNAYTDVAPSTTFVGPHYANANNPCTASTIMPLSNDKDALKSSIDSLVASGSTGGQVGVGWGWYMLSPEFGYIWPSESVPGAYGAERLKKIVVLMTDGEYNSPYCKGVISKDATSGSGSASDHINCNATNGNSYSQAETMCDAMKAEGKDIEVYTIGFRVDAYPRGEQLMEYCATDEDHFFTADDGDELRQAFETIAQNVSAVYLSR